MVGSARLVLTRLQSLLLTTIQMRLVSVVAVVVIVVGPRSADRLRSRHGDRRLQSEVHQRFGIDLHLLAASYAIRARADTAACCCANRGALTPACDCADDRPQCRAAARLLGRIAAAALALFGIGVGRDRDIRVRARSTA